MSVSFFPTVPYPDEIGVNMSYSSFGEVRQIVAELIDKEFAGLTVLPKRGIKTCLCGFSVTRCSTVSEISL